MSLWTPDDSDALDRQARAFRRAQTPPKSNASHQGQTTVVYDGVPRGYLTDADIQRRKKVARAMRLRQEREADPERVRVRNAASRAQRPGRVRWPTPKQKPNGRWHAAVTEQGQHYSKTFDTEPEAQAWLDSITGRTDD